MFSVFFGDNTIEVRQKAFAFLETKSDDTTSVTHVSVDTYDEGHIIELANGVGLFGTREIIILDTLSEEKDVFERALAQLEILKESPNHFIIIESTLTAIQKKMITAHAECIEEVRSEKGESFNIFALTDAFVQRDRKSLWLLLMEAWKQGTSPEEVAGILFWQVKMLRLAERTTSAEEAGQKPFVYQKAKRSLTKFKKGEIDKLSRELLRIYHDGHLGKCDIALGLERWVLTV